MGEERDGGRWNGRGERWREVEWERREIEGGGMGEEKDGGRWNGRGERPICHFDKYTCLLVYSEFTQSCNSFPNRRQSLPRMQMGFCTQPFNDILGNDCPQFEKLLQDCMKLL